MNRVVVGFAGALAVLVASCGAELPTPLVVPTTAAPSVATPGRTVASGLSVPWSVALLPDGSAFVTHRDDATISLIGTDGQVSRRGEVTGVVPGGEGGLLGIAVDPRGRPGSVYVYYTSATDNRIARLDWDGNKLDNQVDIFTGIPKNTIHDGGRIAFGPDGLLYAGTGDAGQGDRSQDRSDLGGKILRITTEGEPAADNPDPGSAVYSYGHRNVQGLAWDDEGRLWASEFGASDVDEMNLIRPGGNYGWPMCEGACGRQGLTDPVVEWSPTAIASPSGMAIADGTAWVASLRGAVVYEVPLRGDSAGEPIGRFAPQGYGRIRDVVNAPDGQLWLVTNNTDGRGDPGPDDDRIIEFSP